MEKERNVVILGADGMLGKDLIELFHYEESSIVRSYSKRECDISKYQDVFDILGGTKGSISNVINCAGFTDVIASEQNEEAANNINNLALKTLSSICIENEIHLTHISCYHVLEGLKNEPYLEQDEAIPLTVYGKTKLAGEGHIRAMGDKGLVIRTGWLYGKFGKKNMIDNILNKLELGVQVNAIEDQIISPTYTMDLANVIIQLSISFKSGLFHVSNSGYCSIYDFVSHAAKLMDYNQKLIKKISFKESEQKVQIPKYSALSLNRLERTLPEPMRKWDNALYQYLIETKRSM